MEIPNGVVRERVEEQQSAGHSLSTVSVPDDTPNVFRIGVTQRQSGLAPTRWVRDLTPELDGREYLRAGDVPVSTAGADPVDSETLSEYVTDEQGFQGRVTVDRNAGEVLLFESAEELHQHYHDPSVLQRIADGEWSLVDPEMTMNDFKNPIEIVSVLEEHGLSFETVVNAVSGACMAYLAQFNRYGSENPIDDYKTPRYTKETRVQYVSESGVPARNGELRVVGDAVDEPTRYGLVVAEYTSRGDGTWTPTPKDVFEAIGDVPDAEALRKSGVIQEIVSGYPDGGRCVESPYSGDMWLQTPTLQFTVE